MSASTLPARAVIREVGLRDGLQAIARTLPTEQKKAWLRGAHAAGQREIEVGSFVPPRLMPDDMPPDVSRSMLTSETISLQGLSSAQLPMNPTSATPSGCGNLCRRYSSKREA